MLSPGRHARNRFLIGLPIAVLCLFVLLLAPKPSQAAEQPLNWETVSPQSSATDVTRPPEARNYIVGGSESTFQQHPWLVQITLNGGAFCGGALVHPMLVLTAAHCLYSAQNGAPWHQLGQMQAFTSRTLSEQGGEELNIAGVGIASNYQPLDGGQSGENDYGLIALSSPSSRPILKIAGPNERALWKTGRTGLVAGFGHINQGGPGSPVLKQLSVPLLGDAFCSAANSYGPAFRSANMLCAGVPAGASGTCQGDSGGALTVPVDGGGRRIVGIVSWGDGCAKPNKPTVYVRAAEQSVSTQINELAAQAGQALNFPGVHADTNIVGSGGKPAGCSAANAAARNQAARASKAAKALKKARNVQKKAQKRLKKAKRKAKRKAKAKARKALNKAKKKAKNAAKKSASAKKKAQAARKSANSTCN